MLKMTTAFSGSFETLSQEESVHNSLIALVSMILKEPNIHEQSSEIQGGDLDDLFVHENQACSPAQSQIGK